MTKLRKCLIWCLMLSKRLYKKPTFLAILLLIPLLVLGYSALSREESGMLTIALASEEKEDALAHEIFNTLQKDSQLIRFLRCEDPEEAERLVQQGKADGAWILEADLKGKICQFAARPSRRNAFIRVLERESTVPLYLAREKLSAAVFGSSSKEFYLRYLRKNVPQLREQTDEELIAYYDAVAIDDDLFEFSTVDGTVVEQNMENTNYLLTPVRGLLAVAVVLCALATAMYYVQDEGSGTFACVPLRKKYLVEFGCQMISTLNILPVVLLALLVSGLAVKFWRELLVLALYALSVTAFSMALRRLFGKLRLLAMLLPLLTVVMLVICPVFFDLGFFRGLQYLFPPTYFINAAYSDKFLLAMPLYSALCMLVYVLAGKLPLLFRKNH